MRKLVLVMAMLVATFIPFRSIAAVPEAGRIRIAHFVFDGPMIDVYVDGKVSLMNVAPGEITGYLDLTAGSHDIAMVPTGQKLDTAVTGLKGLDVVAATDYAVAVVGQATDKSIKPTLINETAANKGMDTANETAVITVHNIKGAPPIDVVLADKTISQNIAYESYAAATVKAGNYPGIAITATGDPKTAYTPPFPPGAFFLEPGSTVLAAVIGSVPGDFGTTYALTYANGTTLEPTQFLAGFSGRQIGYTKELEGIVPFKPQIFSFDTLLGALDKAGLKDIVDGGSNILFAPTDAAFAALPPGMLDKLMADPQALADILRYHIATGTLNATELIQGKMLNTLRTGSMIKIAAIGKPEDHAFGINDNEAGCGCNYWTANNGRIFVIDTVLTPKP